MLGHIIGAGLVAVGVIAKGRGQKAELKAALCKSLSFWDYPNHFAYCHILLNRKSPHGYLAGGYFRSSKIRLALRMANSATPTNDVLTHDTTGAVGDRILARAVSSEVFIHLERIDEADEVYDYQEAEVNYLQALQDFDAFLELIPTS